jgi:Rrf2 family protein
LSFLQPTVRVKLFSAISLFNFALKPSRSGGTLAAPFGAISGKAWTIPVCRARRLWTTLITELKRVVSLFDYVRLRTDRRQRHRSDEFSRCRSGSPRRLSEIAAARGISRALTAKLLTQLAASKFVSGQPGPRGGYILAKNPGDISLFEIVSLFEQMDPPVVCAFGRGWCGHGAACPLHDAIHNLIEINRRFLEETRLSIFFKRKNSNHLKMKPTIRISAICLATGALLIGSGCGKQNTNIPGNTVVHDAVAPKSVAGAPGFSDLAVPPKPEVRPELLERGKQVYARIASPAMGSKGMEKEMRRRFSRRGRAIS